VLPLLTLSIALAVPVPADLDGDGYDATVDCNDDDPAIHPNAGEACEPQGTLQIDDDCDGDPNTATPCTVNGDTLDCEGAAWFVDLSDPLDHVPASLTPAQLAALAQSGFVWDPTWQPPDDAVGRYYFDRDADGHGDAQMQGVWLCDVQAAVDAGLGPQRSRTDCDDSNTFVNPSSAEVCDRLDNNCNDLIDEPTAAITEEVDPACEWHTRDQDADGWGDADADPDPALAERFCICPFYEQLVFDGFSVVQVPEPEVCAHWEGDDAAYGHVIGGVCYVKDDRDCDDLNANLKPFGPDDVQMEFLDGVDNDCSGAMPVLELDCDGDGAIPLLPVLSQDLLDDPAEVAIANAAQVGLASCIGLEAPALVCDAVSDDTVPLTCNTATGLWEVALSWLDEADALATPNGVAHDVGDCGRWDCDDACPLRCQGADEVCDGLDNDCAAAIADALAGTSPDDLDGLADSMGAGPKPGVVAAEEFDDDGDGLLTCDGDTTEIAVEQTCETLPPASGDGTADPAEPEASAACGCASGGSGGWGWLAVFVAALRRRRAA
jgi:MYXO-CTERM domain-containing protein